MQRAQGLTSVGWLERFGLLPFADRLPELLFTFRGDPNVPPARFDASSLHILQAGLSLRLWLGLVRDDRRVPLYNLFNRTPTPIDDGWSVRVTQVRDFRGGRDTYDSHNGTDFAVPVGTTVVAAAPGRVLRVSHEFNRGGTKVFIDHGHGLITTSNHLARALVQPGDLVARGTPVALSGAAGVDFVMTLGWNAPHIHFNVWLDGVPVDPFAIEGETPLWRNGNDPVPDDGRGADADFEDSRWDATALTAAIEGCRDHAVHTALREREPLAMRAMDLLFQLNYYPTRFARRPCLYAEPHPRTPWLDLPLRATDYCGVVFLDRP